MGKAAEILNNINPNVEAFQAKINNPLTFKLFLLSQLPMAFLAGLKLDHWNSEACHIMVRFKFLNQNPFKSIYFAVLSMAAEFSTGLIAFSCVYKNPRKIKMLVTGMEATFSKKAIGKIVFKCTDALLIYEAIEKAMQIDGGVEVVVPTIGYNQNGEEVASFKFKWSFFCPN